MAVASLLRRVTALAAAAAASAQLVVPPIEGPAAVLKPEYASAPFPGLGASGGAKDYFVFLQRFPLIPVFVFFHTEVLVCPRSGFSSEEQSLLDQKIAGMTDFAEVDESWWKTRTADCIELGYGGAMCGKECCAVGHGHMALNKRHAVIGNANVNKKALFIYGTGFFDGLTAFHDTCDKKCWSMWKGIDYNPITNNCNTFTSTVLSCVYGLSEKKPGLGVSDLVHVHGKCPNNQTSNAADALMV
eukprot:CAMPEP_0171189542 /NCGR_PEP_ID=MMETSP0790-20130122/18399_1 /TAXON_ID=2925 /ORGANISM="Alexandrium catenella, Strain OF101" /LENGTH=243 /DNA_ID=CAMNT_0011654655 /DNA_START=61 /DNA_END=792 /DNA_ORIENTATION=-